MDREGGRFRDPMDTLLMTIGVVMGGRFSLGWWARSPKMGEYVVSLGLTHQLPTPIKGHTDIGSIKTQAGCHGPWSMDCRGSGVGEIDHSIYMQ